MFLAYCGFEDLTLRIEVKWQNQERVVLARLEQWPDSDVAVVVCSFEADKSGEEWLVANNRGIYARTSPRKMLRRRVDYSGAKPRVRWELSSRAQSQLHYLVESAFHEFSPVAELVRAVYLPQLPASPRVAVRNRVNASWCDGPGRANLTLFRVPDSPKGLSHDKREAQRQLWQLWSDPRSDARFAWHWTSLTEGQRRFALTGFGGDIGELARLMELVLKSYSALWRGASFWRWNLNIEPSRSRYFGAGQAPDETDSNCLAPWSALFYEIFAPRAQIRWLGEHHCIPGKMRQLGTVAVRQAPTAHEQLEAKLALRDWLRVKATPAQIEQLLR